MYKIIMPKERKFMWILQQKSFILHKRQSDYSNNLETAENECS